MCKQHANDTQEIFDLLTKIIMVKFGLQFITFVGILVHSGKTDMIIFTAEFIIFAKAGHVAND